MAEASTPKLGEEAEATPCPGVLQLEELLRAGRASCSRVDEVWPNLFIGDAATANNRFELWKLGITHVLNAAHGGLYCQGGPDYYGSGVSYLGVPAHDLPDFNISTYFSSAADFIHRALNTPGGRTWGPVHFPFCSLVGRRSNFPSILSILPSLVFCLVPPPFLSPSPGAEDRTQGLALARQALYH
ncbi:dual specificity protein phosphatase 13 [Peromyscus leucopus]|uniref:dual specificity protein phosphatase 13 n=1 Tax=Peromyscus leucopus TaxID=10041 RepID=UPI0018850378|nr:dual specificity protein phosphatase 13 [Peromyscus leucopus]